MIILVINSLGFGGAERQILGLFSYWTTKGIPVRLVVLSGGGPNHKNIIYLQISNDYFIGFRKMFQLLKLVRNSTVLAILPRSIRLMQILKVFSNYKLFVFHRSLTISALKSFGRHPSLNIVISFILSYFDDGRIYISQAVRNDLEAYMFGTRKSKVHFNVFYEKLSFSDEYIVHNNRLKFLYLGRLAFIKGVKELIDFWPENYDLTIIGDGPLTKFIQKGINKGKRNVTLKPGIPRSKVLSVLSSYDVILVPSRIEGFGNIVVEAASQGKWIILNNVDGLIEAIEGYPYYVTCDFNDNYSIDIAITKLKSRIKQQGPIERSVLEKYFLRFDPKNNDTLYEFLCE